MEPKPKLTCGVNKCQGVLKPGKIKRKGRCACNEEYIIQVYRCPKCKSYYELNLCSLIKNPTADQMRRKLILFLFEPRIPTKKELNTLFKKYPAPFDKKPKRKTGQKSSKK